LKHNKQLEKELKVSKKEIFFEKYNIIFILDPLILNRWFNDNVHYPYPDNKTKNKLSVECELTIDQITKWMANKRFRRNLTSIKNRKI
jgi:hypothetical protein